MGNLLETGKRLWARWHEVIGACLLAILAVYLLSGYFTTVRFDEERIEVSVEEGLIHVCGFYHYRNVSHLPAALTLGIPFPVDRDHALPETYTLAEVHRDGRLTRELVPRGGPSALHIRLLFRPGEGKWIRLDYWQRTRSRRGCYLLTTTRAWGRPIRAASFRLRLPPGYHLDTSNYRVWEVPGSQGGLVFTFSESDFFPDRDWTFSWQAPQSLSASREGGVQ